MAMKTTTPTRQRQGSIFILLLFLLPIIVLVGGFAVDIAYVQRTRAELRSATDLAAKAAAMNLSQFSDTTLATNKAIEICADNKVAGQSLTVTAADVLFGSATRQVDGTYDFVENGSPTNAVKVTGRRTASSSDGPIISFFGHMYGHQNYEPEISAFAAFIDVDICLVLDRSGSMKLPVVEGDPYDPDYQNLPPEPNSRWFALDGAVRTFLTVMNGSSAQEQVSFVTFASDVTTDVDLTTNMSPIYTELDDRLVTVWNGSTDIHAGIVQGESVLTGMNSRPLAQKVMVVLTDGNYTEDDPVPAATSAAGQDITIHTITFGEGADQTTMQSIASVANGNHYHADNAGDLTAIFQEIAATLTVLID